MKYDVFISYRRNGGFETARHLYDLLLSDGYSVSFDLDTLREGAFNMQLLSRIDECEDFIIVIDRHAFDRTLDPTFDPRMDWMRIELSYALSKEKNVVPVLLSGAGFPENLPEDIRQVIYKNVPEYSMTYFDAFYLKLKGFLHSKPGYHVTFHTDQPCYVKEAGKIISEVATEGTEVTLLKGEHHLVYERINGPVHSYEESLYVKEVHHNQEVEISFLLHPRKMSASELKRAIELVQKADKCTKVESDSAILLYKEAAELGYPEGLFRLSLVLLGNKAEKDTQKGVQLIRCVRSIAEQGDGVAQYCIGQYYDLGIDPNSGLECESNEFEALNWYRRSASQGYIKAQIELGDCYKYGFSGVEENEKEALEWYRRAAAQGSAEAMCRLGRLYSFPLHENKDEEQAARWFRRAAELGSDDAMSSLADCYRDGTGVEENKEEAVKWYRRAAEQGNRFAQYSLGDCLLHGEGVEVNEKEAVEWFKNSARQGSDDAQFALGNCYQHGIGGRKDLSEAIKWYQLAADQNLSEAQSSLGDLYLAGVGVEKSIDKAIEWYRLAAENEYNEDSHSQYMLGMCYFHGAGVRRDWSKAVEWFRRAAENVYGSDPEAQWCLAKCYMDGLGVEKDRSYAMELFDSIPEELREEHMTLKNLRGGSLFGRIFNTAADVINVFLGDD